MSLRTYVAAQNIKTHLQKRYTEIELAGVTYTPETESDDGVTTVKHFAATFKAASKEDGHRVQGRVVYTPQEFRGGPGVLESAGPFRL